MPVTAITPSSTRVADDGTTGRSLHHAPLPRTAVKRSPVAWFATSAHIGPLASTAQIEIAQYGIPRAQLVEPSTGSSTIVIGASGGPVSPDSSLSTADSAVTSSGTTA